MDKKNILTYEGLKKLEDELEDLKVLPEDQGSKRAGRSVRECRVRCSEGRAERY